MNTKKIKDLMDEQGINNKQLAEDVGVTRAMIGSILKGYRRPSVELAVRIAERLGCTVDDIVKKIKED